MTCSGNQNLAAVITAQMHDFSDDDDDTTGGPGGSGGTGSGSGSGSAGGPLGHLMGGLLPGSGGGPGGSAGDPATETALSMLTDYNAKFATAEPAQFRDETIDRLAAALISKDKPSAFLIGPAGVGKTRVVEELARRIACKDATVPPGLRDKTIYEFSLTSLMAGTMYRGMLEEKLKALIAFASDPANKAVLFIDEIHQLVPDSGGSSSHAEVAQSLKPALARGDLRVIGATTDQEGRSLTSDPAFARRFTRVGVSELNQDQTLQVLDAALPGLLTHYRGAVSVQPETLETVIAMADEHLSTLHRPDSALTLLDKSMARLAVERHKPAVAALLDPDAALPLTRAILGQTAESMHGSDAVARGFDEQALMTSLERIKGQEHIIEQTITLLRRDAMGIFPRRKPLAWLFAGTSGVGKTEVARQIAHAVMGTEPIVLNMAEFSEPSSITRLTGSSPGYVGSDSNREMPFDPLDANPRQVILLDEFEKAHRDIQRLFLSALDAGTMQMAATGKTVDFSKAIIIATTNAGRDDIAKGGLPLGFTSSTPTSQAQMDRAQLVAALTAKGAGAGFEPELLGRFSLITAFRPISEQVYSQIVASTYDRLRGDVARSNPLLAGQLPQQLPEEALTELVSTSYTKAQGARPAEPAVRQWIEELLDPA